MSNPNAVISWARPPTISPTLNIANQTTGTINCNNNIYLNNHRISNLRRQMVSSTSKSY